MKFAHFSHVWNKPGMTMERKLTAVLSADVHGSNRNTT